MQQAGQGCRRLHLTIYRTDGDISHLSVAMSALSRDPVHLNGLFRDKLDRINPGYGFDLIALEAADLGASRLSRAILTAGQMMIWSLRICWTGWPPVLVIVP